MPLTLLQACQDAAAELQLVRPANIVANPIATAQRLWRMANKAASRIAGEFYWPALLVEQNDTAVAGETQTLPADYYRMADRTVWVDDNPAYPPTNNRQWELARQGGPTWKFWQDSAGSLIVRPALAGGEDLRYTYQSENVTSNGLRFAADGDTWSLDDELLVSCIVLEWSLSEALPTAGAAMSGYRRELNRAKAQNMRTLGTMTAPDHGARWYPDYGH